MTKTKDQLEKEIKELKKQIADLQAKPDERTLTITTDRAVLKRAASDIIVLINQSESAGSFTVSDAEAIEDIIIPLVFFK